jgi:hypothetical protein
MLKQVFRIDEQGFFVEPVLLKDSESTPSDCVTEMPTPGLFRAKRVGGKWTEGMPQTVIDSLQNVTQPVSELDQLKKKQELMQAALDDLLLGGGL